LLAWRLSPLGGDRAAAATETLLRLTTTATGKPMRELSLLASELATSGRRIEQILGTRNGLFGGSTQLPETLPPSAGAKKQRYTSAIFIAFISIVLVAALIGGGLWLQDDLATYRAGLPQRIEGSTAVLSDTLSSSSGILPQQALDAKTHTDGKTYSGGFYHLQGATPGTFVIANQVQQSFGDAAYEVTASLTSDPTPDSGTVGLVFHSDASANNFLIFVADSDGSWELDHYHYVDDSSSDDWTYLAGDYESSAVHAGLNASNTLLAVTRGDGYLLYVNGHLVESGQFDDADNVPNHGYTGVYLDDGAMQGAFSNFSVYPAPPLSPTIIG
jgi:hypothetical protein